MSDQPMVIYMRSSLLVSNVSILFDKPNEAVLEINTQRMMKE